MANSLQAGSVAVNIIGNDNQFQVALNQAQNRIKGFSRQAQTMFNKFERFAIVGAAVRTLFAGLATHLKSTISEFSNFGDQYAKMARRTGVAANDLSQLGFAAEQSGANVEDLGNGLRFLNRNLAEAGRGGKAALEAFDRLGIDFAKLQGLTKKDQFLAVAEHIRQLGDEALQTDAAMKLFGKGGTALLPMFQEGSGGIQKLMAEAEFNGIGISNEDAVKAEVLNDAINRISQSMKGLTWALLLNLTKSHLTKTRLTRKRTSPSAASF